MEIVSDLHLHSKYSRAVSRDMTLPVMAEFANKKGINLLTTGDFTHPLWLREIKSELKEVNDGIYSLKNDGLTKFILSVEVSSIYSQGGKTRRVHSLLFAPNIEVAEKINQELIKRGCNLSSDGRPIVGLTPPNLLEILLSIDKNCFLIPCHVWTPWFSLYGSMSGFDSIEECFGKYKEYIWAVETGLSSDPSMNWRIEELDSRSIVSFSDSHSPMKMGREATVFKSKKEIKNYNYIDIRNALKGDPKGNLKIGYTLEFYPEEGKYHFTGHRNCKIVYSPKDTKEKGTICPRCNKKLTVGVMERVEALSFRDESQKIVNGKSGIAWITDPTGKHPPYAKLVQLIGVIAECLQTSGISLKAKNVYDLLIQSFGTELNILLKVGINDIQKIAGEKVAMGVLKVRNGDIFINPGYDGEYGVVKIKEADFGSKEKATIQASLEF